MKNCEYCGRQNKDKNKTCYMCGAPFYDINAFMTLKKYNEEHKINEKMQSEKTNKVRCFYCNSTDVKKISASSRWLSTGLFGLSSKKLGKEWHCNNCGSNF